MCSASARSTATRSSTTRGPLDHADFRAQDARIAAQFDELVRTVPLDRWDGDEVTPGWTLRDHVGHLADWAAEGVRAIDVFHRRGHWLADPDEGIDAWNERHVAASRGEDAAATTLARLRRDPGRAARCGRHADGR